MQVQAEGTREDPGRQGRGFGNIGSNEGHIRNGLGE